MKAVYKKDLKSAFTGMIGWMLCAFVVVVVGLYFTAICLQSGYADFSLVLYNTTFIFLVVVPLLTMRSIVEERRQKTDQLLLTSRASIAGIVWGKYLALVTVYAIPLAIVGICPLVMRAYGSVSLARSYAALLAFFLMGAAAIAIGLFMSSLTENQIIVLVCILDVTGTNPLGIKFFRNLLIILIDTIHFIHVEGSDGLSHLKDMVAYRNGLFINQ